MRRFFLCISYRRIGARFVAIPRPIWKRRCITRQWKHEYLAI